MHKIIEKQHEIINNSIDKLYDVLLKRKDSKFEADKLIDEIINYFKEHFETEETILFQINDSYIKEIDMIKNNKDFYIDYLKNIKILYIDDQDQNLNSFKALFRRDFNLFCFEDPKEAVEFLKDNIVHIVLADQRMSKVEGVEFLKLVKEKQPGTIRMLTSAYTDIESVVKAINLSGIQRYIDKPWDYEKLKNEIINAYLEKKLLRKKERLDYHKSKHNLFLEKLEELKKLNNITVDLILSLKKWKEDHINLVDKVDFNLD